MAWLQDNGDENEYSQFDEDEGGEKDEGIIEETEEEVTISERPGAPVVSPQSAAKSKTRKPSVAKKSSRKPARPKARPKPKKKAAAKSSKKSSARKTKTAKSRRKKR